MIKQTKRLNQNESGLVAIIVTVILTLVITLITLGFSQVTRREQRQALDTHLNTRAFYAAESGINAASAALQNGYTADKDDCGPSPADTYLRAVNYALDGTNTGVTCLLIDQTPEQLEYSSVSENSKVIPIVTANDVAIDSITISWQSSGGGGNTYSCNGPGAKTFPVTTNFNCGAPVLRVDLVPTQGVFNSATLDATTYTAFLYPGGTQRPASVSYGNGTGNNQGVIEGSMCTAPGAGDPLYACAVTINGLGRSSYHARIRSIYGNSSVRIFAISGGAQQSLKNAQAIVDSTARAADILKRLQVRIPVTGLSKVPGYAIESAGDICKRYFVIPSANEVTTDKTRECSY